MSFDLAVWGSPKPVTAGQALQIYQQLCDEQADTVKADAQVEAFYQQIIGRFPPLESTSYDEIDRRPWSMSPEASPGHVIMTIQWPRAKELREYVIRLAAELGLVCFDPQSVHVHNPPRQDPASGLRMEFCDGSVIDNPEPGDLRRLLQQVSERNWYAILEREPGWYVQVGIGEHAGPVRAGKFAVEYREGTPDRHYRALVTSLDDVVTVFERFATGEQPQVSTFAWKRLSL
jgi:hypothetical protein